MKRKTVIPRIFCALISCLLLLTAAASCGSSFIGENLFNKQALEKGGARGAASAGDDGSANAESVILFYEKTVEDGFLSRDGSWYAGKEPTIRYARTLSDGEERRLERAIDRIKKWTDEAAIDRISYQIAGEIGFSNGKKVWFDQNGLIYIFSKSGYLAKADLDWLLSLKNDAEKVYTIFREDPLGEIVSLPAYARAGKTVVVQTERTEDEAVMVTVHGVIHSNLIEVEPINGRSADYHWFGFTMPDYDVVVNADVLCVEIPTSPDTSVIRVTETTETAYYELTVKDPSGLLVWAPVTARAGETVEVCVKIPDAGEVSVSYQLEGQDFAREAILSKVGEHEKIFTFTMPENDLTLIVTWHERAPG